MSWLTACAQLTFGLILLTKGANFLVNGASTLARRFHVSELVIGLTVVAFGTSAPELFVNIVSSVKGNTAIAIGNVLGSNVANIFLILGISAVIYPLTVSEGTVWKEIPFSLLAAVVVGLVANDCLIDHATESVLTRIDGLVLLCFFAIFMAYSFGIAKRSNKNADSAQTKFTYPIIPSLTLVVTGIFGLGLGGKWIVDSAVFMAMSLGMSEAAVGLSIVAVGTSLPELATSAMAARERNVDIAIGNVVGSNIFNLFFVLGISSTIKPLPFEQANNLDLAVVLLASAILLTVMFTGTKRVLERWEGAIFLVIYFSYVAFRVTWG